ncbi:MAG: tetratricopeptide repeat protein [Planctomycetaceae bacterium]|nr:tetratricopeptide repeat protein [Planctomycetaceae bacterium]
MKSEERHHLHENDLAGILDRNLKKIEPYSNQILIGILVATVLAVGIIIWQRSSGAADAEAWGKFAKAATADEYLTVAEDHPGTNVARWAQLRAGEQFLNQGLRTATSDRKSTEDNLKQAESAFQSLLQGSGATPQVRERALYGLALARETLSNGDTSKAIEAYEELRNSFPDSHLAGLAEQRMNDLKQESTRDFYAWFDRQPRKPEDRPKPKDLVSAAGGTADPFLFGDDVTPERPAHSDRPPSPSAPTRASAGAQPFPAATDAETPPASASSETPPATPPTPDTSDEKPAEPASEPAAPESDAPESSETPAGQ